MAMGRPKAEIKQSQFESLCKLQCTEEEICSVFGVCEDTLNSWCKRTYKLTFSEVYKQKRLGGRASLRRMQFALAEKSAAMAIFLGKNMLGQRDEVKVEQSIGVSDNLIDALNGTARKVWKDGDTGANEEV